MKNLFIEAKRVIPGGVNSPVRAFNSVGMNPLFIRNAKGKHIYTEMGKRYIDFCSSWGPMILGHAHPAIQKEVISRVKMGTSFGAPTKLETALAKLVCEAIPSMDRVRFVSSGTEAVMSAIRVARGFTKRDKILKFDGCYHGHSDCLLVKSGSGVTSLGNSSSQGVPRDLVKHTLSIPFNDMRVLKKTIEKHGKHLAAVIVEPIPGNMGVVLPREGFLKALRALTKKHGVLLIFDEVITGFRVSFGGAQARYNIKPDLTTLGKIIGGGFPVGAFGGKKRIMDVLAPQGDVYQAGTLSGNPVAMAAGLATINYLKRHPELYKRLEDFVAGFADTWRERSKFTINNIASMFTIFFTTEAVMDQSAAMKQDANAFRAHYRKWLKRGLYMPPSMFETAFVGEAHSSNDLKRLI